MVVTPTETYRDKATQENTELSVEDGLRDVLITLKPFDAEDTARILLAVSALYGLGLRDEEDDDEATAEAGSED